MAPSSTVKRWAPFKCAQPVSVDPSNRSIQPSAEGCRSACRRRTFEASRRQRERDDRIARLRAVLAAAPRRDHDVLPSIDHVQARRRIAARRQLMLPEHASRALFERPDLLVGRGGDEDHPAGRRNRAAEVQASGIADALRDELRVLPERHLPGNLPFDEVDRVERAPGWRDRRHTVRIQEQWIAIDGVAIGTILDGAEPVDGRRLVDVDVQHVEHGIEARAVPFGAAKMSWRRNRALQARRRVNRP